MDLLISISLSLLVPFIVTYVTIKIVTYVTIKIKNFATKQDISKITNEVEKVKLDYQRKKYTFEHEYSNLKKVWESMWELQAKTSSLHPLFDQLPKDVDEQREVFKGRYEDYKKAFEAFQNDVLKCRPFIPKNIYNACIDLRGIGRKLEVDFVITFTDYHKADWEKIYKCNEEIGTKLDNLSELIRARIVVD